MMNVVRTWTTVFILIANASVIFIRLESDSYRNVPADKLQIDHREVANGERLNVSVNVAWARGWYSDAVAASTTIAAVFLLVSLLRGTSSNSNRVSVETSESIT